LPGRSAVSLVFAFFFFSSRRRHTRFSRDWSSDVCSSDLEQALDESYPLLERLKFLLIFSSNLDEFFEIRVAGLKEQIAFAREQTGPDGLQPHQVLAKISEIAHQQVARQYSI